MEGVLCMSGINAGWKTGRRNVEACRDNFLALQERRLIGNIEGQAMPFYCRGQAYS
jgi:hypothetical protein